MAAGADDRRRFELLLRDYEATRADGRAITSIQVALLGAEVALLAGLAALVVPVCQLQPGPACARVPDPVLAASPLAPVAILVFLQLVGTAATVRNFYMRALETELRAFADRPFADHPELGLGPASYVWLITGLISLRRGRPGYRILFALLLLIALVIFGGLTAYIALHLSWPYRVVMAAGYGTLALLLVGELHATTLGARGMFEDAARRCAYRLGGSTPPADPSRGERSSLAYLAVPRLYPPRWLIIPGLFGIAAWAVGSGGEADPTLLLVLWFALDVLVDGARWQWRDVRAYARDGDHRHRPPPGRRLPVRASTEESRRLVAATLLTAVLRLAAAVVLGVLYGTALLYPLLVLAALMIGTTAVAEELESRARPGAVAPTLSAARWVPAATGDGARAATALALAGLGWLHPITLVGAGIVVALAALTSVLSRRGPAADMLRRGSRGFLDGASTLLLSLAGRRTRAALAPTGRVEKTSRTGH